MIKGLKELKTKYEIPEVTKTGKTLEQYGYGIPAKPKETTLSRVFNLLRTGEFAMGGLLAGKGISEGIRQKIQPSTVLGVKSKVGRLATDILFDPTTYLTFGYGGAAKLATKTGGQIILSKAGTKLLRQTTKKVGEKAARKSLAEIITKGGLKAEKRYIAKGGIKFLGKEIVPRKVAVAPFKGADIGLAKIPIAGRKYVKGKELVTKMFKPFAEIEKLPAKFGGKGTYVKGIFKPFSRKTSADITRAVEPIIKAGKLAEKATAKPWYKFQKPKVGEEIAEAIEKGVSGSKVVDDIAKWMGSEHKIMIAAEKGRGISKTELPNYLRHFITDKGREFLDVGGNMSAALSKPLRVKLKSATPRKLEGTIKEINKAMKGKIGGNFFEPDAFKAFAGRKVEHIKAVNTYDFLQYSATRFSRPAEYFTKADGTKVLKKTVIDGVEFVESTAPQLKGVVLPKPIVQHIDETSQLLKSDEAANVVLKAYDDILRFWKGTVTGYFPAFHTRNFVGGVFNNWLAGLKNPMRYKQATKILSEGKKFAEEVGTIPLSKVPKKKITPTVFTTKLGTKYTSIDILKMAKEQGVTGQTGMMDVMREVQKEIGKGKLKKLGDYPRFLMETVENRLRLPLFVDRLIKGDAPQEAAEWVFRFHFDYVPKTGMTAFEKNWMKRLIPFYTWTRNNIPLQFEQMIKQPGKYASLEKTRQAITGKIGEEEFEYLPDWMREQFTMRIGKDKAGQSLWLQLDLPLEDLAKLPINESGLRETVSMLSPLLKFPIERYTNENLYFGGEIVDPLLKDHPELQTRKTIETLKYLPEPIKKFLNFKKVQYRDYTAEAKTDSKEKIFKYRYEMDAKKLHLIRSAVGRFYMTVGQWFDPETADWIKTMRLVGGVPVRPFDIEEEKEWREYEREEKERKTLQYLKKHKVVPYKGEKKPSGIIGLEELEAKYKPSGKASYSALKDLPQQEMTRKQFLGLPEKPTNQQISTAIKKIGERNEVWKKVEPKYTISAIVDFIRDKLPFLRTSEDIGTERALKKEVMDAYDYTDEAKEMIKDIKIKDVSPVIEPVLGIAKKGRGIKPYGGVYTGERATYPEAFGKYQKITLKGGEIGSGNLKVDTTAHELLHHFWEKSNRKGFDVAHLYEDFPDKWEEYIARYERETEKAVKEGMDETEFVDEIAEVMFGIDSLLDNHPLYQDLDYHNYNNERFAHFGDHFGRGGLKNIPKEFQEFYAYFYK